jgi:hypothetical protein
MTAKTLDQVREEIEERRSLCFDETVQSRSLEFHGEKRLDFELGHSASSLFSGARGTGYLNDNAFKQVASRFGVPPVWVMDGDDCPPALRKLVMDWKFGHVDDKKMLLRATSDPDGDILRAVLSDRYQPYDHHDLWGAIEAACATMPVQPWVLPRGPVGDDLRGYLVLDNVRFDADQRPIHYPGQNPAIPSRTGDGGGSGGLQPAVYFSNNEIGTGRVRISAGLFRSYCSNGMIYGWKEQSTLSVTHLWSQKNHIALAVHEAIANALTLSEEAASKMVAAMNVRIEPTKLDGIFEKWARTYGIALASKDAWRAMVSAEPSMFDAVNAATVLAQKQEPEECENFERMAGDMLASMTPTQ